MIMNEVRFRRRLPSALLIANLVPLAALSVACGGSSAVEAPRDPAAGGHADHEAGAAGSAAASGHAGDAAGGVGSGAGTTGGSGAAGNSGGSGGVSGSGASAGRGGASGGSAGASGGSAGASGGSAGASGGSAGDSGGSAGDSGGSAGMAGSAGNSAVCHARPPQICAGGPITLPKTCVADALASVGTSLPLATCGTMCEAMFVTFSCAISAVQPTTITVQCVTGCPASQQ